MADANDPSESFIAKLKHYKSQRGNNDDKRIVVELVQEGSASADFLKRMEERRRSQLATRIIDMRGKVAAACRSYEHERRVHYMDERCIQIFEQSLAESDGKYTVGVYEDVTNAAHTNKAKHQREQQALQQQQEQLRKQGLLTNTNPSFSSSTTTSDPDNSLDVDLFIEDESPYPKVEVIQLGYQVQRREPRMTYIMDVELLMPNGKRLTAKTRDVSRHGIKIMTVPNPELKDQTRVRVQFLTLLEQHGLRQARPIEYKIMGSELSEDKLEVRLLQENFHAQPDFDRFLVQFIDQNSHRYKIELTDAIHALKAKVFERFLTPTITHVPLFLRLTTRQPCQIELIAATSMNVGILERFVNVQGDIDLSALITDKRLQQLTNNKDKKESDLLVYCFYSEVSGKRVFYSASDAEFANAPQKQQFIYLGLTYDSWRVYRLKLSAIQFPDDARLRACVANLANKSEEESEQLLKRILGLTHKISIFDLTDHCSRDSGLKVGNAALTDAPRILMPFGSQYARHGSYQLVNLGHREHRCEPRYLHQTDAEVSLSKQKYTGITRDFSIRGMQILLPQSSPLKKGDLVMVSLNKLQKQVKDAQLTDMPYRVVGIQQAGQVLMLERDERGADSSSDFFRRLIRNNADRLSLCLGDSMAEAEAKLMESLVCSELSTLPFFISQTSDNQYQLSQVAISENTNTLLSFFRDAQGINDLRSLADPQLLHELMDNLNQKKQPFYETEIYLVTSYQNDSKKQELKYSRQNDFASAQLRRDFIIQGSRALDYRYLLLRVSLCQNFKESEFEQEFDSLRQQSKNQAKLLTDELNHVIAVGYLIDLSQQILQRERKDDDQ